MPSLGDVELFDAGVPCSGAAFLASRALSVGFERQVAGVSVTAKRGSRWIIVKLTAHQSARDLFTDALGEAQLGLDLLARRGHFVELENPNIDHLSWRVDAIGPRMRAIHLALVEAPKINMHLTVTRADGTEAPPPTPVPWHPLLRFYRLAHLAEDPIERFRYLYLGIENAISSISAKGPSEGEPAWIKRVLRSHGIDCSAILRGAIPVGTDPVDHTVDLVYTQARLPAFHAKHGQNIFLPADANAVRNAASACDVALRLLKSIGDSLGQKLGGSGVFQHGFEMMTEHLAKHGRIQFSTDIRKFDPEGTEFSDPAHPPTELATTTSTDQFVRYMRATLSAPSARFARVGLVAEGRLTTATCYEAILDTSGFAEVEFVLGIRMIQPGASWTAPPPP